MDNLEQYITIDMSSISKYVMIGTKPYHISRYVFSAFATWLDTVSRDYILPPTILTVERDQVLALSARTVITIVVSQR